MDPTPAASLSANSRLGWLNSTVVKSWFGKRLKLAEWGSTFTMKIRVGTATFLTMAYILVDSDATCSVFDYDNPTSTYKFSSIDPNYTIYLEFIRRDLIIAMTASSIIDSIIMGAFANLPLTLAPGMSANAYFAYTIVDFHGSDNLSYGNTLATVFLEGLLFLLRKIGT
ncbi:adenine/guanine permease AZG1-like [Elaeis guineensis]|uniref:adenine/guanine permease AZG1-like n=1 Tax=Elaeis guineensis var. tenera TaxID=51953 RepID=UPI003C6D5F73